MLPVGAVETYHRDGKWRNRVAGMLDSEFGTSCDNKADAVLVGFVEARARRVEHVVWNLDGTLGERNNYGSA